MDPARGAASGPERGLGLELVGAVGGALLHRVARDETVAARVLALACPAEQLEAYARAPGSPIWLRVDAGGVELGGRRLERLEPGQVPAHASTELRWIDCRAEGTRAHAVGFAAPGTGRADAAPLAPARPVERVLAALVDLLARRVDARWICAAVREAGSTDAAVRAEAEGVVRFIERARPEQAGRVSVVVAPDAAGSPGGGCGPLCELELAASLAAPLDRAALRERLADALSAAPEAYLWSPRRGDPLAALGDPRVHLALSDCDALGKLARVRAYFDPAAHGARLLLEAALAVGGGGEAR